MRIAHSQKRTVNAMNYLLELALLDHTYLKYRASVVAAAAFCLANILTGPTPWPAAIEKDTGMFPEGGFDPFLFESHLC